jgi:biofilm PGA synthesis lipoprotein PgaB
MTCRELLRLAWRTVGACALVVAFALPVYIFVRAGQPDLPSRLTPPAVAEGEIPRVLVPAYSSAVAVLVYHDISDRLGRYTVSPRAFANQMAALKASGFHTISAAQLIAFLDRRGRLPLRPLLITFDDGLGSAWRAADPILAKYGFRAVSFVISGQLGQHGYYYLHPGELHAMVRSGRWDVEAHTHLAHLYVPTDSRGDYGPALTDREWLPRRQRLETRAEFEDRIARDLDLNIAELHGYGASPQLFAYPFSAAKTPTNDPAVVPILHSLVAARFQASFVDADGRRFVDRYDAPAPQELPRIEVYHDTTAGVLLRRLSAAAPSAPDVADAFSSSRDWIYEGASIASSQERITADTLTLHAPARHWIAAFWAPGPSELWRTYRASVIMRDLGRTGSGTSATMILGSSRTVRYAVAVSAGHLTVERLTTLRRRATLAQVRIRPASSHRLEVTLARGRLLAAVDRRSAICLKVDRGLHGGIGLGAWRSAASSPIPSFAALSIHPVTSARS